MKNKKRIVSLVLALSLVAALLVGCGTPQQAATHTHEHVHQLEEQVPEVSPLGGVLCLKINPEIAVHYDANGKVTKLEGRNRDGAQILESYTGFEGKDTSVVLAELVNRIGQAGYLVEEAEGEGRKIVLELDPGSNVPHDAFLEAMAAHVEKTVETKSWVGETEYEYSEPIAPPAQQSDVPAVTPNEAAKPAAPSPSASTVPAGLCPICGDDDCDDGQYCDDADEKAENLREYEAQQKAKEENVPTSVPAGLCPICGDDDCDDGQYCDDADEKAENLREQAAKESGKRCPVCGDDDCDDGQYCDDYDD